ncbi:hypothetical protein H5410_014663 [Solanum commersonii]|uniref:SWIM-type domain-containing protein n=1 Tax=Solanum commersonii TaxID=4109 RepID=A0A9J5ZS43_SOLCO|nr:hypothetical protein H5410_014663 [Solanum commersonii]
MSSLAILVMHSGKWDDTNCYVDYTIEGIVFKEQATFLEFYTTIATHIGVDVNTKILKIEYKVEKSNKPMVIHNDMGVRVQNNLCQSSSNEEMGVLATVAENGSQSMIVAELEETNVAFVSMDTTGVISDASNKHVEVDQASNINKSGMFIIRAFNTEHTCPLKDRVYSQRHATSNLKPKLVDHKRKYTPSDIKKDVKIDLGVDVNYMLAWRAKEKALESLRGTPAGSYAKLPAYLYMMDVTYPGSHIYKNESIIKVVTKVYDNVPHYACMWHLWNNVQKKFRKSHEKLTGVFYTMAKACTQNDFDMLMDTIEKVVPSTEYVHNVNDDGRYYVVCLRKKTCTCGRFQYEEIPCEHAWAVLKWKSLPPDDYCFDLYKSKTMLKTYNMPIHPLPDVIEWVIPENIHADEVLPSKFKRPPDRPKNKPRKKNSKRVIED